MKYLFALVLLASCARGPDIETEPTEEFSGGRFTFKRVQLVKDGVAYNGQRAIYVLVDTETGKEYVGVSGVGIAETGHHTQSNGKSTMTVPDER